MSTSAATCVAAIVRHGGAGNTGASLASGVPTLAIPFVLDQYAWGECISTITRAPRPIAARGLTSDHLVSALDSLLRNHTLRAKGERLGQYLRAQNGVRAAVQGICGCSS
jgi:sterol 3beta-glucosyltransferase